MSQETTYVVGHKSPDTDAIAAAVGYADLHRRKDLGEAIPVRLGDLRPETQYLLDRFGVPVPVLLEDVRLRVRDAMTADPAVARPHQSLLEVGRLLQEHNIRTLPITDENHRLLGIVSAEQFARLFFEGLDPSLLETIHLELDNIVSTLGGRVLVAAPGRKLRDFVMVGAMDAETMKDHVKKDCLLVLGDRADAQRVGINRGAAALIVTGNLPVAPEVIELARRFNVTVISSPHRTFTTVRLLNMSVPVRYVMQERPDVATCSPDSRLEDVHNALLRHRSLVVVDEKDHVVGMLGRTDMLHPRRHQVILVDHNERSQSVDGLEEAEVVGIIDHHRIGDVQTTGPIHFRNEPVGATATLITEMYQEAHIDIPPGIAGVLLGAVLADTMIFRSPTSTERDWQAARTLTQIAQVEALDLGETLFEAAADLKNRTPRQIILADFKEFIFGKRHYGVGTLETMNRALLSEDLRAALLAEMQRLRQRRGYDAVLLTVSDIIRNETELLVVGREDEVAEAFQRPLETEHSLVVDSILSRKKQVVPVLAGLG